MISFALLLNLAAMAWNVYWLIAGQNPALYAACLVIATGCFVWMLSMAGDR